MAPGNAEEAREEFPALRGGELPVGPPVAPSAPLFESTLERVEDWQGAGRTAGCVEPHEITQCWEEGAEPFRAHAALTSLRACG